MNRRFFLTLLASSLSLKSILAGEILRGSSAKVSGERERKIWQYAEKLKGLRLAKPNEFIQTIVFFDPNCPACRDLWNWFDGENLRGIATLWVPVVHMNKSSMGMSINMLRFVDAYKALSNNFSHFDPSINKGATVEAQHQQLREQAEIRNNNRFWSEMLFSSTPLMLYRKRDGTYWQEIGFSPKRMAEIMGTLAPSQLSSY
jgi:hypothetical protein